MSKEPQGVIAILTGPDGDVIATDADFNRSTPGGCALWEGQKHRAQLGVKYKTVHAYCSTTFANAMSDYLIDQLVRALCSKGHKISFRGVGYPEDVAAEIARR